MFDPLGFDQAAKAIPELATLRENKPDVEVVIIGYHNCPYSRKALAAKGRHPKWQQSGHVLFVAYDFGATGPFRETTKYRGTFPLVYVKQSDGTFQHIGGGTEFEAYVDARSSKSQASSQLHKGFSLIL